ncbi:septation ring formation regulator EzrA [Listeria monocytogenes]|nr:septation ring formation regulator EzrA [Listeria monocytogenes]
MYYMLIGFIIVVIAVIGAGYILKRKHYQRINELEEKKIKLRERPVIDELSKVKKLKLTGQTEALFESWRSSWDEIETRLFPNLEEVLLEAEMNTDRYKFRSATHAENDIEQMLVVIEKQMDQILGGLKELLISEEKNAKESRATKEKFAELRREVLTRGFKLGETLPYIETKLSELSESLNSYDSLTDQGDHLEAREIVIVVQKEMQVIEAQMERIPSLLHETDTILPEEMTKLRAGYEEMVRKGYYLAQMELDKEISRMKNQIDKMKKNVINLDLDEAEQGVEELHNEIDLFYDTLEHEAEARHFVKENHSPTSDKLQRQNAVSDALAEQITEVKQTYHVAEDDLAVYLKTSAKLSEAKENFEQLTALIASGEIAYSAAQDTLKEIDAALITISTEQDKFAEELRSLRKDELEARDDAERMRRAIITLDRKMERERLPGLPEEYLSLREHMGESIDALEKRLEEKPLNMKAVSQDWRIAEEDLTHLTEKAEEMMENVRLVEHVIQYANRYRLRNKELADELVQAENHFYNDYQYKKALEIAVTALEKVETGAFKKVEKAYESKVSVDDIE